MPRIAALFTPREQLDTRFGGELTPEIARLGHVRILTEPHECGTPNFQTLRVVRSSELTRQDRLGPSRPPKGGTPNAPLAVTTLRLRRADG